MLCPRPPGAWRLRWLATLIGVGILVALFLVVVILPPLFVPSLGNPASQATTENAVRTTLLQGLGGAALLGADLTDATLRDATADDTTQWPEEGFDWQAAGVRHEDKEVRWMEWIQTSRGSNI